MLQFIAEEEKKRSEVKGSSLSDYEVKATLGKPEIFHPSFASCSGLCADDTVKMSRYLAER